MSLLMDAVHNFSDEFALLCLFLAYCMTARLSKGLQRSANLFNSVGLIAVSGLILWQALDHLLRPSRVIGWLPLTAGLVAAAGNWGVTRFLRPWRSNNASIRLAYFHNLSDVYVSLLSALAGVLVSISGMSLFDPLLAAVVAAWLIASTVQEIRQSGEALLWPEDVKCSHETA